MSFLDDLRKKALDVASRAYDEVNQNDGGKNWNQRTAVRPGQQGQQSGIHYLTDMTAGNAARLVNTANSGVVQPIIGAAQGKSKADINRDMLNHLISSRGGLLNVGTFFPTQQAYQRTFKDPASFAKGFTAAGVGTATEVAPMARGASLLAKPGLSAGAKILRGAAEGSVYGGAGTAAQQQLNDGKLNVKDIAKGAAFGAALGGGIPAAGAAGKVAGQATQLTARHGYESTLANIAKNAEVRNVHPDMIPAPTKQLDPERAMVYANKISNGDADVAPVIVSKAKDGSLKIIDGEHRAAAYKALDMPVPTKEITVNELKDAWTRANAASQRFVPGGTMQDVSRYAAETNKPEDIVSQTADYWYKHGKENKGGQLINRSQASDAYTGDNGMTRISDHGQFYRDFFKANKKAPTKADYQAEVTKQLEAGGGSMVEPDMASAYQLVNNRNAENEALVGATPPPTPPKQQLPIKPTSPNSVPNRLTVGAKAGRQNLSPEAMAQVQGEHVVRNTQNLQNQAINEADKSGIDKTVSDAYDALNVEHIGDREVAQAQQAIERADAAGRTQDAVNLHDMLSEHLTKQGQTIQAASLLYRLSPQGLFYKGMRDIKKGGGKVTPELEQQLKGYADDIKNAASPDEKDFAVAKFHKTVADSIPQDAMNSAISVWKAGLLSGPITHAGNALSNSGFGALKKISDVPAAGMDMVLSALGKTKAGKKLGLTGERTKTATLQGIGAGTKKGFGYAKETLNTGIDRRNLSGSKYETHGELNFKNKVVQNTIGNPSNYVFRAMSAGDQPFYYAAAKNSLFDQALAAGKNQKLRGNELQKFAKNLVDNPTKKMAERAQADAEYSVLSQKNAIAQGVNKFAEATPGGVGHVLVPFTKVPTNFLAETLDYTPVGPVKSLIQQVKSAKQGKGIDQRALSEAIGRGATGTAVMVLGSALAAKGLLSGQYPSTDQKEAQRWKAEGITPNSIKIGDKWISANYLGPVGMLMQAGKDWNDAHKRGDNQALAAIGGFGKSLTQQSFLTGFSGFNNAIQDPQRNLTSFINSQAGSVVPNALNQAAQALDPLQRQANNVPETIQSRLPFARESLNPKQDVYGNDLKARTDPAEMLLNPLRPSNANTSPVLNEVNRLHSADPNNKDLQVTPEQIKKVITIPSGVKGEKGTDINLTDQQRYDLQKKIGQATQDNWGKLIQTPEYQALSDTEKANALNKIRQDTVAVAQRDYVTSNNLAQYKTNLTASQQGLAGGTASIKSFTKTSSGGSSITINPKLDKTMAKTLSDYSSLSAADRTKKFSTEPDAEFKYEEAKYQNDKANGSVSGVQDVKRQKELAKAQVGASVSKETRDLYSLSKADLYSYVNGSQNGDKLANELLSYDKALYDAGLTSYLKFKTGLAPAAKTASSSRRSSGGTKSTKSTGTAKASKGGALTAKIGDRSSAITLASSLGKKISGAKVGSGSRASFKSKISRSSIKTYKKADKNNIRVTRKQLV